MDAGFQKVSLLPERSGYAELEAGYASAWGPFVRTEAGWHRANLSLFGFGQWDAHDDLTGGIGARVSF